MKRLSSKWRSGLPLHQGMAAASTVVCTSSLVVWTSPTTLAKRTARQRCVLHSCNHTSQAFTHLRLSFQFVELRDSFSAERAVQQLHNRNMGIRRVEVSMSSEASATRSLGRDELLRRAEPPLKRRDYDTRRDDDSRQKVSRGTNDTWVHEPTRGDRSKGTLQHWDQNKGYGFIRCGSGDVFVHATDLQGVEVQDLLDASCSMKGTCLEFTKVFNEAKGKPFAMNVTRLSDSHSCVLEVHVRSLEDLMVEKKARGRSAEDMGESAKVKQLETFGCSPSEAVGGVSRSAKPMPAKGSALELPFLGDSHACAAGKEEGEGELEGEESKEAAAAATEETEAVAKVKMGGEAGGARARRAKLELGKQQGRVKREGPPLWPRDAHEEVEFDGEGESPTLKSEEVEVEAVKAEAAEVEAAEVEMCAAAAQERPRKRSSSRDARPTEPYVAGPASGRRLEESPSAKAAAPVKLSGNSAAPTKLDKGTRLQILWEDDDPPTWYAGMVIGWGTRDGRLLHHILYDDRQRQQEELEDLQWRLLNAAGESGAMDAPAVEREEEEFVIAMPSEVQAGVRRTRSKRREVKLQEEDVVDGLTRCPGCGLGVHMANGGCNVTSCLHASKHGGRYYYFCAHCKAECPDGESMCTSCPMRNDRETRVRVKARREREWNAFLSSNSAENPSEVC